VQTAWLPLGLTVESLGQHWVGFLFSFAQMGLENGLLAM